MNKVEILKPIHLGKLPVLEQEMSTTEVFSRLSKAEEQP